MHAPVQAGQEAVAHGKEAAVDVGKKSEAELRDMLVKCASTSLNSKLVSTCPSDGVRAGTGMPDSQLLRPAGLAHLCRSSNHGKLPGVQVSGEKVFFAEMVVAAVQHLDPSTLDLAMLGTKKVQGGGLRDSFLVDGVAFKKTFSYAGGLPRCTVC